MTLECWRRIMMFSLVLMTILVPKCKENPNLITKLLSQSVFWHLDILPCWTGYPAFAAPRESCWSGQAETDIGDSICGWGMELKWSESWMLGNWHGHANIDCLTMLRYVEISKSGSVDMFDIALQWETVNWLNGTIWEIHVNSMFVIVTQTTV